MKRLQFEITGPRILTLLVAAAVVPISACAGDEKDKAVEVASDMAAEVADAAPEGGASDKVAEALSATWPGMAADATVVDWDGTVLREGNNGYICLPSPPDLTGTSPMCMDDEWMKWANAWQNRAEYSPGALGISYMLAGDEGASNIDPYAEGPTEDNEWIEEGAHLMIVAPAELLEAFPTDPYNGGPYVMWKGTPYQHLMVPVGPRDDD